MPWAIWPRAAWGPVVASGSSFRSSERRRRMAQPAVIGAVIGSVIGLVAPIAPGSVERGGNEYVSRQRLGSRARLMFGHRLHRIGGLAGSQVRIRMVQLPDSSLQGPQKWPGTSEPDKHRPFFQLRS